MRRSNGVSVLEKLLEPLEASSGGDMAQLGKMYGVEIKRGEVNRTHVGVARRICEFSKARRHILVR